MITRYTALFCVALFCAGTASAQATLNALDVPLVIDFFNTVPGVNNGPFNCDGTPGAENPNPGQLDLDAWDYFVDGTTAQASGNASAFPGTLPAGNGFNPGGSLATGLNATEVAGQRALGIQPTGGHFTAGSITLRVQNNTGAPLQQLAVSYTVGVFNDRDRSNLFTLLWSASNSANSYVEVPASEVVSPLDTDTDPEWMPEQVSVVINGFSVPQGGSFYLRWLGDDIAGGGQRDEFALTHISLTAQAVSGPVLVVSTNALPAFSQVQGTPSATQSFTVSGSGLVGEVAIATAAPFQLALNAGGPWLTNIEVDPVGGSLTDVPVFVRLNNTGTGPASGTIAISSPGATGAVVNVTGATTSGSLPVLYINELQASNISTIQDENGEFDDWFEIYNPGSTPVDLAGWYVSDDEANPTKYRFSLTETNALVPAGGWLLVWADNQSAQGNLHTNFALSSTNGESILLTGPDGATIVDQIDFGPQVNDVSYGRATDGGTPWVAFNEPTPGASNNPVGIAEVGGAAALRAWPLPVEGGVLFLDRVVDAMVYDAAGREVLRSTRSNTIDVATLRPGMYTLRTEAGAVLRFVVR
jgi:hypothetical protein